MTAARKTSRTHRDSRLANLALAVIATTLSVLVAEWGFRWVERGWLNPELPELDSQAPIDLSRLRYNDGQVQRHLEADEFRILGFGDSFAYSVMVPELSYSGILQSLLQKALPDRRIRVVNLGEPATSPRNYRESYDFWSPRLEHQAVLFLLFQGNDVLDDAHLWTPIEWSPNVGVIEEAHPILAAYNPRVPQKFPLRMLDYAWAWWMSTRTLSEDQLPQGYNPAAATDFSEEDFLQINKEYYFGNFDPERLPGLLPGYEQVLRLFKRAQAAAESGRLVAVALAPGQPQVDAALRQQILSEEGRSADEFDPGLSARIIRHLRDRVAPDVLLLDLTLPFQSWTKEQTDSPYFRRNTHWDQTGNRLAGEWLAEALLASWFQGPTADPDLSRHPTDNVLVDSDSIEDYLSPLFGKGSDLPEVSGGLRSVLLFDGVTDDSQNLTLIPFAEPLVLTFDPPRSFSTLRIHLADKNRRYRFRVDTREDGQWTTLADYSEVGVADVANISVENGAVSALRIVGIGHSDVESHPDSRFLYLHEVEFLR